MNSQSDIMRKGDKVEDISKILLVSDFRENENLEFTWI